MKLYKDAQGYADNTIINTAGDGIYEENNDDGLDDDGGMCYCKHLCI